MANVVAHQLALLQILPVRGQWVGVLTTGARSRPHLRKRRHAGGTDRGLIPDPSDPSQEDTVTAPFIFIATHQIKPGKRQAFQKYFATFCSEVVEPEEPRLHSFYGYTAPDSDLVTMVQVHPDASSMATHMKVGVQHFAEAYAEYLEPESTVQIYGTLTDDLINAISAAAQTDGDENGVTVREPFAGFDRLPQS
jgi:quinol monooxygenase YgiN